MHAVLRLTTIPSLMVLISIVLCACDKPPPKPTAHQPWPVSSELATQTANAATLSVPPAESVLNTPATATKTEPTAGRSNSAMSRDQESTAMPMPGQNNDHSAPLNPPKSASGPARL